MDPLSIIAGVGGIADISTRLVHSIRQFQQNMDDIDEELEDFVEQINSIKELCFSIKIVYTREVEKGSPDLKGDDTGVDNLWVHLGKTLNNCLGVAKKLEGIIVKIHGNSASSGLSKLDAKLDAFGKVYRKKILGLGGDLDHCRAQLATHQSALQLFLTAITHQDVSNSQDYNAQSFGDLSSDVQDLNESLRLQISDLQQGIKSANGSHYDVTAIEALKELRESVTSVAATIKLESTNHYFDIPQSVSSIFTGREALLRELHQTLISRKDMTREVQRRFIIYGLGGSGKTQFCCKFAEDYRDTFWGIFWIDASAPERIKQTLGDIAEMAGLERNEKSALHWMSSLEQRWLLIIDNADDEEVPLAQYFPRGNRGNVLVTTKNPANIVHGTVGCRYFEFRGLELDEATQLLLKASNEPSPWDPACEKLALSITKALGSLALAIIHAGAAISSKLCDLKDYLAYYGRSWRRIRSAKLTKKGSVTDHAAYATWEICYDRLEQKGTEAAVDAMELLNVLAFLHWETISPEIFVRALRSPRKEAEHEKNVSQQPSTSDKPPATWADQLRKLPIEVITFIFKNRGPAILPKVLRDVQNGLDSDVAEDRIRDALKELAAMSLIIRNNHSDTYSMHPIVHIWARERPRMRLSDQALWSDVTGRVLAASILLPPLGSAAADEKYHINLLPHVWHVQKCRKSATETMSMSKPSRNTRFSWITSLVPNLAPDADKMRMYAKFSLVYAKCGRWENAEALLKEVKEFLCRYLGPEHKRSRQATLFLSRIYWELGRSEDAAALQSSVLDLCTTHLGPSHPDTLRAMGELANTRWQEGQFTTAHILQRTVLDGLRLCLPPDDPDILEAMDNLGRTVQKFWEKHHFEEALQLHSDAAEGMARVHGPDHERTLWARESMCRVSVLLGGSHVAPALTMMTEVLETRRTKLGKEHSHTLLSMANMAIVLSAMGRPEEAEALIHQGLPVADRNLGSKHQGTLFGRHTLACVLVQRGRYAEAETLLVRVAEGQKRIGSRGDYHPERLGSLVELARCCYLQGKVERAIAVSDEAIRGFDTISTTPHPLATGLRAARTRMGELIRDGSNGAELPNIPFPPVLFRAYDDDP